MSQAEHALAHDLCGRHACASLGACLENSSGRPGHAPLSLARSLRHGRVVESCLNRSNPEKHRLVGCAKLSRVPCSSSCAFCARSNS
jgi:hypothetical protein